MYRFVGVLFPWLIRYFLLPVRSTVCTCLTSNFHVASTSKIPTFLLTVNAYFRLMCFTISMRRSAKLAIGEEHFVKFRATNVLISHNIRLKNKRKKAVKASSRN